MHFNIAEIILCISLIIIACETVEEQGKNAIVLQNKTLQTFPASNSTTILGKIGRKHKKKGRRKYLKVMTTTEVIPTPIFTSTHKPNKRKRKRRRRKKMEPNSILEVTTASAIYKNNSLIRNNETVINLIKKLNENPEQIFKKQNRCNINNGGCSQICKISGKRKCQCLRGFVLTKSRRKCVDVDECRIGKGGCSHVCRNTLGSFFCECPQGFRLGDDAKSCQDVNECHLRNGHGPCQDSCINTYGSYLCNCSNLNGTRLALDKHTCQHIDECEEGKFGCSHICINTRVGAFCSCPEGMELMSDYKTCQDIDECEDMSITQSCNQGCVNTIGSYYCEEDFQKDQSLDKKKVLVCPPLEPPVHGFITCQRDSSSASDTYTKNGRRIIKNSPGTKCQLNCPYGFKLIGGGRFICGIYGQWINKKGFCVKATKPQLECPKDKIVNLHEGQQKILVKFSTPRTNVKWKIVKSYPKWAKRLQGELGLGLHRIMFSVTDPMTKLSSSCSFSIIINRV